VEVKTVWTYFVDDGDAEAYDMSTSTRTYTTGNPAHDAVAASLAASIQPMIKLSGAHWPSRSLQTVGNPQQPDQPFFELFPDTAVYRGLLVRLVS
jgi:hypothetical protein